MYIFLYLQLLIKITFMRKAVLFIGMVSLSLTFSSCRKEGCTDGNAENFSSEAKSNDGSCHYEGKAVIWYDQSASIGLINDNATSLTFYVDGKVVGSTSTSVYWTSSPDCGSDASITVTKDLGSSAEKTYSYKVIDQTGFEYWSGNIAFSGNSCQSRQLVW